MEKYITDERTGLRYEFIGDIYYIAGNDEPEKEPIGVWGQRHLRYIREHRHSLYCELLMTGRLNGYLADIDRQAKDMLLRVVDEMAQSEGLTEQFKSENQMEWVRRMNNIRNRAEEIVNSEWIYRYDNLYNHALRSYIRLKQGAVAEHKICDSPYWCSMIIRN